VKGNQVGGGGESVADTVGMRSDLVLTIDQDKSDHDRSGDSMPRGRRERSGPPRFNRGLYYCYSWYYTDTRTWAVKHCETVEAVFLTLYNVL